MKYPSTGIAMLCKLFGKTRDAWYKSRSFYQCRANEESVILETVRDIRTLQPKMGVHKLHHELNERLASQQIRIGRNRLADLLRQHNLMVRTRKKHKTRTTNSNHRFRKWPNLIKDFVPSRPEELVVSDITYWRIEHGFIYISLVTDAYSHMILGFNINQHLYTAGALAAMEMALEKRRYPKQKMIHHSDRGFQYCSKSYIALLQQNDISISMTQSGDPTENPIAERINGILKQSFGLPVRFQDYNSAIQPITNAIRCYNYEFPHGSIDYLKPYQAHLISGEIKKRWKVKKK